MTMSTGPGEWFRSDAFTMPVLPDDLQVDPVLAALLHAASFLELSGDESVHPDRAVDVLEHLHMYLARLDGSRVHEIRNQFERICSFGKAEGWSEEYLEFIREFTSDLESGDENGG
jgi:hypothetical protein